MKYVIYLGNSISLVMEHRSIWHGREEWQIFRLRVLADRI